MQNSKGTIHAAKNKDVNRQDCIKLYSWY